MSNPSSFFLISVPSSPAISTSDSPTSCLLNMNAALLTFSFLIALAVSINAHEDEKESGSFKMFLCRASGIMWSLKSEVELDTNKMHQICDEDFRRGFSIRCEPMGAPEDTTVSFYIGGKLQRRETSAPYYLKGNTAKKVHAMFFGKRSSLRITCKSKGFKSSWVTLSRRCEK